MPHFRFEKWGYFVHSLLETARRYVCSLQRDYIKIIDILNGHRPLLRKLKIVKNISHL